MATVSTDGNTLSFTPTENLHFDGVSFEDNFTLEVDVENNPGTPAAILRTDPVYTVKRTGSSGRFVPERTGGQPILDTGLTKAFEFQGTINPITDLDDFIVVNNGPNAGIYQITALLNVSVEPDVVRVQLDRDAVMMDGVNGIQILEAPSVELVSIFNEGDFGSGFEYTYTFRVTDPRVTAETPIKEIYRVERLARPPSSSGTVINPLAGPPAAESGTQPAYSFDMFESNITIIDYQTFSVRDDTGVPFIRSTDSSAPGVGMSETVTTTVDEFAGVIQLSGNIDYEHRSGVESVQITTSRLTLNAGYRLSVKNLFTQVDYNDYEDENTFTAMNVNRPRLDSVAASEDVIEVTYDEAMRQDSGNLNNPKDYTISGPSLVTVQKVQSINDRSVALLTQGLMAGDYTLTISASTPKDVAGNPLDPTFNSAIFTATTPLQSRSIFTDKGPINKPPLTLQTGTAATLDSSNTVTLTGAALTLTDIGKIVRLSSSASNNSDYKISAILSTEQARVVANFILPDANDGTIDWRIIDPRTGQIADDPSDVTVRINGSEETPEAVIGLRGQVVLSATPDIADTVEVDYDYCCNPRVEIRRLNSQEFRLNGWNRDYGGITGSHHHYRFNNVLVDPSNYDPDNLSAALPAPKLRGLKYRAYERAYTAVLNDPNLLLLNTPNHKIAYPPASRPLTESSIFYEGLTLPENDATNPWARKGTGTASVLAGVLTVNDNVTGPFPTGEPLFWTQSLDLTFDHIFSAAWRFSLDSVTTAEGIWTGVAAGYSDDLKAYVVGFLDNGGTKQIGFLKVGTDEGLTIASSWIGGVDGNGDPTGAAADLDWSVLHSYRISRDQLGTVRLYVDGDVIETLRIIPDEAPNLEELNSPFDEIQGAFFGSLSREAESSSSWDFYRYLIQPINIQQSSPSSFVSYEANLLPEVDPSPWTPIGFHGTASIVSADTLLLDATSGTDSATSAVAGLVGGDFKGYLKVEPLLTASSQFSVDFNTQLLTYTHSTDPDGLAVMVDDGNRLIQLSFIVDQDSPLLSYGGRSLPTGFSPYVWSELGTQTASMLGRYLNISDTDNADGKVYFVEDTAPVASTDRVISSTTDYILECRCRVNSFTADGGGFAGAFMQAYDSTRSVGILLKEVAGVRYVAFHSDGADLAAQFAFEWNDGGFHTYRVRKSTTGNLVSVFADNTLLGTLAYSSFTVPPADPVGVVSFGSSTAASAQALSDVDWAYCNAWRINTDVVATTLPRKYVGLWKGSSLGDLRDYHVPLKAQGKDASVIGNTITDPLADFITAGVAQGDKLVVDVGSNAGIYTVDVVLDGQNLTLTSAWPLQPSKVNYRIAEETDWTIAKDYRIFRNTTGEVSVFSDAAATPIIATSYDSINIPASGTGFLRTVTNGLPAVAFGAFSPENLSQSQWGYLRYGITKQGNDDLIVPPHQILNQWNVMESPERLFSTLPFTLTDFKSSSTGITPQTDPDFLDSATAYTQLNERTPIVPLTQTFENRGPYVTQVFTSTLNDPEDLLNSGDFLLNDDNIQFSLVVPDDILYTCLKITEDESGETNLIAPFDDDCQPMYGALSYQNDVCLDYTADTLPENDTTAGTPWVLNSDNPAEASASAFAGELTYSTGAGGTKTVYLNNTPLPDAPSLQTTVTFRLRLLNDSTSGTGDSQVRFGMSAPGMTIGLGLATTSNGDRLVLAFDINSGAILGQTVFDFLDGNYHTYTITRNPSTQLVEISVA